MRLEKESSVLLYLYPFSFYFSFTVTYLLAAVMYRPDLSLYIFEPFTVTVLSMVKASSGLTFLYRAFQSALLYTHKNPSGLSFTITIFVFPLDGLSSFLGAEPPLFFFRLRISAIPSA
ncbi:unnamed protein product [Bacillus phage SPP1]|uniref:Bacteriophage SPP1 complete nucleotide sequence n=1 Tax=Bacillus phage SPP1 TaxID=10724 RepID=O48473_BPSPP|nr:hypothetical protein SPP1p052 [Bacillus phage SPP1]CAA66520.1 unnamed protein product [Bacillus phage SPP1]